MAKASRLQLHEELCELLGSRAVYFQPPENLKMTYPCIRYSGNGFDTRFADNRTYKTSKRYTGIIITPDPDSDLPERLMQHFPMCNLGSEYTANNLNHYPFTLYY